MSKAVQVDTLYNKELFTELLLKAKGGLSIKAFAQECGVSHAYMCKYLNGRFDKSPTPNTIKKISNFTIRMGVTEEDLLSAAGYSVEKYSDLAKQAKLELKFEKQCSATILNALAEQDYKWTVKQGNSQAYNLLIELENSKISYWFFNFITEINKFVPASDFQQRILLYYARLICKPDLIKPQTKYSFVTDSEAVYNEILQTNPALLPLYMSVILIDTDNLSVLKEEYLKSYLKDSNDINISILSD